MSQKGKRSLNGVKIIPNKDNLQNNEQDSQTKPKEMSTSLAFIISMLGVIGSFIVYGYFQEELYTFEFNGKKFHHPELLLMLQFVAGSTIVYFLRRSSPSKVLDQITKTFRSEEKIENVITWFFEDNKTQVSRWDLILLGVSTALSPLFSHLAIQHLDFPIQVVGKSAKTLAVVIFTSLVFPSSRSYNLKQKFYAYMIGFGAILYSLNDDLKITKDYTIGVIFLLISLASDGTQFAVQDRLKMKGVGKDDMQHMGNILGFSATTISLGLRGGFMHTLNYFTNMQFISIMVIAALCNVIGSTTCYFVVQRFGSLTLSIITNIRKFFSVILSIVVFNHPLKGPYKISGLAITFVCSLAYMLETATHQQKKKI